MIRTLILAAVLALAAAGPASAHAVLEGTAPERGAQLDTAPAQVVLRFSEPVEIALGAVRVYDARGREVQAGAADAPARRRPVGRRAASAADSPTAATP